MLGLACACRAEVIETRIVVGLAPETEATCLRSMGTDPTSTPDMILVDLYYLDAIPRVLGSRSACYRCGLDPSDPEHADCAHVARRCLCTPELRTIDDIETALHGLSFDTAAGEQMCLRLVLVNRADVTATETEDCTATAPECGQVDWTMDLRLASCVLSDPAQSGEAALVIRDARCVAIERFCEGRKLEMFPVCLAARAPLGAAECASF
jgi:hypothetical protein